ncbi:hypothetical protein BMW23_0306 [Bodo saltans virus]|uniref:Uncharacterized protein n=1 Tax=Bodo saltans virus TaxID=2024608 RepID=A0A2H4UU17_9VIRU|nr:hypothetical protein QJ851_gp0301 [Bodo saltans virus]ATZ80364.1 hypothetical protein BMW23_0306 [Bodo saltans virus]
MKSIIIQKIIKIGLYKFQITIYLTSNKMFTSYNTFDSSHRELLDSIKARAASMKEDGIVNEGKILNDFTEKHISDFVELKGVGAPALHEIHIFLAELNPTQEQIELYSWIVEQFNETYKDKTVNFKQMKAPLLALYFRNHGAYVSVLQSSHYFSSDNKEEILHQTYLEASLFLAAGFNIIRLKIEASMHGIENMPMSGSELTSYYEHHIRVKNTGDMAYDEETNLLNEISIHFSNQLKTPIPMSYNKNDKEGRRYLNVRFRNMGYKEALEQVKHIVEHINNNGDFRVVNHIDEIIICDSFVELDKGWIDFTDEEKTEMFA